MDPIFLKQVLICNLQILIQYKLFGEFRQTKAPLITLQRISFKYFMKVITIRSKFYIVVSITNPMFYFCASALLNTIKNNAINC